MQAVTSSGQAATVEVHSDGSVSLTHSGIEVGQGINTKAEQAVVSVDVIHFLRSDAFVYLIGGHVADLACVHC
jgi:xanthine dehydrogenase molybdopterin-binding subunit B